MAARDGSPFDCGRCGPKDRTQRNCGNSLGLSEAAKAVFSYTEEVAEEIKAKGAEKVFSLRGLRLYECPLSFITWETREMIRAVYLMEGGGRLFFSGGWGEQSAWLIEAFEIFKAENAAFRKDVADGERAG